MGLKYLLLKDVEKLGHSGDIKENIAPGYARNFLIPQKLAVVADKRTIRLQEKLKEEREKKRLIDRQESQAVAKRLEGVVITQIVKVDHDGHMYGSVTVADIVQLLSEQAQVEMDKKSIQLKQAIKKTGEHTISLKLKEDVMPSFQLKVLSEEGEQAEKKEEVASE